MRYEYVYSDHYVKVNNMLCHWMLLRVALTLVLGGGSSWRHHHVSFYDTFRIGYTGAAILCSPFVLLPEYAQANSTPARYARTLNKASMSDSSRRRLRTLRRHLCAAPSAASTPSAHSVARQFAAAPDQDQAWDAFVAMDNWKDREAVVLALTASASASAAFRRFYRRHLAGFIREDFYDRCPREYKARYESEGEINVPLLQAKCLPALAAFGHEVAPLGKHRYAATRPTYPPGEVLTYASDDPRVGLLTEVNMTAVPSRHLPADSPIQWVYHSPHLRGFLSGVMGCPTLYPYLSDLGLAINIMEPALEDAKNALGFHFDSIDSSSGKGGKGGSQQPKGATGVIGITDCDDGGERVVFPGIHREHVVRLWLSLYEYPFLPRTSLLRSTTSLTRVPTPPSCLASSVTSKQQPDVAQVLRAFDPRNPDAAIVGGVSPRVCREPTAGVLFLFNGGDVLHGVSSVRKGARVAAVFLFQETPPAETEEGNASASFFYDNTH